MKTMEKIRILFSKASRIKKISFVGMALSIAVIIFSKLPFFISFICYRYGFIRYSALSEILFGLGIGFITSSIVALYVEGSNARILNERSKYVKQTVLRDFSIEINRILGEFSSGGDRQIDYIPYHYEHFVWSITDRILPFAKSCDAMIDKYTNLLSRKEIEAIDAAKRNALGLRLYLEEPWATDAKSRSTDLVRLYEQKVLGIKSQYRMSRNSVQQLDEFVETLSKDLGLFQNALILIKQTMPYIFDR